MDPPRSKTVCLVQTISEQVVDEDVQRLERMQAKVSASISSRIAHVRQVQYHSLDENHSLFNQGLTYFQNLAKSLSSKLNKYYRYSSSNHSGSLYGLYMFNTLNPRLPGRVRLMILKRLPDKPSLPGKESQTKCPGV